MCATRVSYLSCTHQNCPRNTATFMVGREQPPQAQTRQKQKCHDLPSTVEKSRKPDTAYLIKNEVARASHRKDTRDLRFEVTRRASRSY